MNNPRLRFLTKIKMIDEVVARGYGPNKQESKTAAAQILLQIICPKIFKEWSEKLKTLKP